MILWYNVVKKQRHSLDNKNKKNSKERTGDKEYEKVEVLDLW